MSDEAKETHWIPAIAVVGTVTAGLLGFVGAFFSFFSQDFSGFGLCVVGSAVAFGLLTQAVFRK